ncbi:hypothetical protein ACLOJK_021100 [Asimina triloba]
MEKEENNQRALETDFLFQWGSRKRIRCTKVKRKRVSEKSSSGIRSRAASRVDRQESPSPSRSLQNRYGGRKPSANVGRAALGFFRFSLGVSFCVVRNSDLPETQRSSESQKSPTASPDKEEDQDRYYYATRASGLEDVGKMIGEGMEFVWPKFFLSLSCKEKEEDFMAMKGCKLPHRPKKRAKFIQKCLQAVSPGSWLPELSLDRYEVREKKNPKKLANTQNGRSAGNMGLDGVDDCDWLSRKER